MNRRRFLARVLGAAAAGRGGGFSQDERPPNIVMLVAGGWRGQALPFAGDRYAATPNLQRLSNSGVWFPRAYTPNPESDPAKAALLTGRYPHAIGVIRDGIPLPAHETTLATLLTAAGYSTGLFGGWNTEIGITGSVFDFLRQPHDRPFFIAVTWQIREDEPVDLPETPLRVRMNVPAEIAGEVQRKLTRYYAECTRLDGEVGSILTLLEEHGSTGNTVVVFTADRGAMLGSHSLFGDGQSFEEAVRVPLLIQFPRGAQSRRTVDMPVCTVDLAPTLLRLAGRSRTGDMQGDDLSGWLAAGEGERSESVYCQGRLGSEGEWRMVVRGFDKIVVDRELNISHLFNLRQDPYEMENLASEKGQRTKRDEMLAILDNRLRRVSDKVLPSGLKLRD